MGENKISFRRRDSSDPGCSSGLGKGVYLVLRSKTNSWLLSSNIVSFPHTEINNIKSHFVLVSNFVKILPSIVIPYIITYLLRVGK